MVHPPGGRGERLTIIVQHSQALKIAHVKVVVHRHVKPANILVDRSGRAKIADFGIAKLLGPPPDWDRRAELYALGVILNELLTGEQPVGRSATSSTKARVGEHDGDGGRDGGTPGRRAGHRVGSAQDRGREDGHEGTPAK